MIDHRTIDSIRQKYALLENELDERARRCWAASEALALGYGGISAVAQATGLARNTVAAGIRDAQAPARLAPDRIRHPPRGPKSPAHPHPAPPPAPHAPAH